MGKKSTLYLQLSPPASQMQTFGAPVGYFTCAQARQVGRTPFSHTLDKYGVHGLHSTFLIAWMMTEGEEETHKHEHDFMCMSGDFS